MESQKPVFGLFYIDCTAHEFYQGSFATEEAALKYMNSLPYQRYFVTQYDPGKL